MRNLSFVFIVEIDAQGGEICTVTHILPYLCELDMQEYRPVNCQKFLVIDVINPIVAIILIYINQQCIDVQLLEIWYQHPRKMYRNT